MTPSAEFRQAVTFIVVIGVLCSSIYLVLIEKLNADSWFSSWTQTLTMMVGFYFATRSNQTRKEDGK